MLEKMIINSARKAMLENITALDKKTLQRKLESHLKLEFKYKDELDQLTNNWNELEEWLKEYMRKNEKWYTNELSTHDKQYYGDAYYTTNAVLMTILDKMKEIKNGDDE